MRKTTAEAGSARPERMSVATLQRQPGEEYDERVFGYFLAVERARAARLHGDVQLLLLTLEPDGNPIWIERLAARRLFAGLRRAVRDTDLVGWYRRDRVAGAILTHCGDALDATATAGIVRRVGGVLRARLSPTAARNLRLQTTRGQPEFGTLGETRNDRTARENCSRRRAIDRPRTYNDLVMCFAEEVQR